MVPIEFGTSDVVSQVSVGSTHACAVFSNGRVRCWGSGGHGKCGTGDVANSADGEGLAVSQINFIPFATADAATQVSCGGDHTCVLFGAAGLRCFGRGLSGRLGTGSQVDVGEEATDMVALPFITFQPTAAAVVSVSAGRAHTCAVFADGAARCWGENASSQLGTGDMLARGYTSGQMSILAPIAFSASFAAAAAVSVSAGDYHSCAAFTTGHTVCWGSNGNGRLGIGNTDDVNDPSTLAAIQYSVVGRIVAADPAAAPVGRTATVRLTTWGTASAAGFARFYPIDAGSCAGTPYVQAALAAQDVSATEVIVTVPAGTWTCPAGAADVRMILGAAPETPPGVAEIVFYDPPRITAVVPHAVDPRGGSDVTLFGDNLLAISGSRCELPDGGRGHAAWPAGISIGSAATHAVCTTKEANMTALAADLAAGHHQPSAARERAGNITLAVDGAAFDFPGATAPLAVIDATVEPTLSAARGPANGGTPTHVRLAGVEDPSGLLPRLVAAGVPPGFSWEGQGPLSPGPSEPAEDGSAPVYGSGIGELDPVVVTFSGSNTAQSVLVSLNATVVVDAAAPSGFSVAFMTPDTTPRDGEDPLGETFFPRTFAVRVSLDGGMTFAAGVADFEYYEEPTVLSISPSAIAASLTWERYVTLFGTGFLDRDTIRVAIAKSPTANPYIVGTGEYRSEEASPTIKAGVIARADDGDERIVGRKGLYLSFNNGLNYAPVGASIDLFYLASLAPASGPRFGGTTITLSGEGFVSSFPIGVKFYRGDGGTGPESQSRVATFVSATEVQLTSPPAPTGWPAVSGLRMSIGSVYDPDTLEFEYFANPSVSAVTPDAGPIVSGYPVTLHGTGLAPLSNRAASTVVLRIEGGASDPAAASATGSTAVFTMPTIMASSAKAGLVQLEVSVNGGIEFFDAGRFLFFTTVSVGPVAVPVSYADNAAAAAGGGTAVPIPLGINPVTVKGLGFTGSRTTEGWRCGYFSVGAAEPVATSAARIVSSEVIECATVPNATQAAVGSQALPSLLHVRVAASHGAEFAPVGSAQVPVIFYDHPVVTAIVPLTGPLGGGGVITILGSGFNASGVGTQFIAARFGSVSSAAVPALSLDTVSAGAESVTVTVPASSGAATTDIELTVNGRDYARLVPFPDATFRYFSVERVEPTSGVRSGGTVVTVFGTGFQASTMPTTMCRFSRAGASITVPAAFRLDATRIACVVPEPPASAAPDSRGGEAASGSPSSPVITYAVEATTNGILFTSGANAVFSFAAEVPAFERVAPSAGPASGGSVVTVAGTGFPFGEAVLRDGLCIFGSAEVPLAAASPTEFLCVAPASAGPVQVALRVSFNGVIVVDPRAAVGITAADTLDVGAFAYYTVSGATPSLGPSAGGTTVTVTGNGFSPDIAYDCRWWLDAASGDADLGGAAGGVNATFPADFVAKTSLLCSLPAKVDRAGVAARRGPAPRPRHVHAHGAPGAPATPASPLAVWVDSLDGGGATGGVGGGFLGQPRRLASATRADASGANLPASEITIVARNDAVPSSALDFTLYPAPTVSAISPTSLPGSGGLVTVLGDGFLEENFSCRLSDGTTAPLVVNSGSGNGNGNATAGADGSGGGAGNGTSLFSDTAAVCLFPSHGQAEALEVEVSNNGQQFHRAAPGVVFTYTACKPGTFAEVDSDPCMPCAAGSYTDRVAARECIPCGENSFTDGDGATECLPCPTNTVITGGVGDAKEKCLCERGFFRLDAVPGLACDACPEGGECMGGTEPPRAVRGYWSSDSSPASFVACESPAACPGGSPGSCGDGHTGRLCADCEVGFFKSDTRCNPCPSAAPGILAGFCVVCVIMSVLLVRFVGGGTAKAYAGPVKIATKFFQVLAIVVKLGVRWPLSFRDTVQALTAPFTLNVDLLASECSVPEISYSAKWIFTLLLPVFFSAIFAGVYFVAAPFVVRRAVDRAAARERHASSMLAASTVRLDRGGSRRITDGPGEMGGAFESSAEIIETPVAVSRRTERAAARQLARDDALSDLRNRVINAFVLLVSLGYLLLVFTVLELFACTSQPDGTTTLNANPSLLCYEPWWWQLFPAALIAAIVYVVGIPLSVGVWLRRNRDHVQNAEFSDRFGSLYSVYRAEIPYWEAVVMIEKFIIAFLAMILTNFVSLQMNLLLVLFMIGLVVYRDVQPFVRPEDNKLHMILRVCSLLVLCAGQMFLASDFPSDAHRDIASALAIGIIVIATIFVAVRVVRDIWGIRRGSRSEVPSDLLELMKDLLSPQGVAIASEWIKSGAGDATPDPASPDTNHVSREAMVESFYVIVEALWDASESSRLVARVSSDRARGFLPVGRSAGGKRAEFSVGAPGTVKGDDAGAKAGGHSQGANALAVRRDSLSRRASSARASVCPVPEDFAGSGSGGVDDVGRAAAVDPEAAPGARSSSEVGRRRTGVRTFAAVNSRDPAQDNVVATFTSRVFQERLVPFLREWVKVESEVQNSDLFDMFVVVFRDLGAYVRCSSGRFSSSGMARAAKRSKFPSPSVMKADPEHLDARGKFLTGNENALCDLVRVLYGASSVSPDLAGSFLWIRNIHDLNMAATVAQAAGREVTEAAESSAAPTQHARCPPPEPPVPSKGSADVSAVDRGGGDGTGRESGVDSGSIAIHITDESTGVAPLSASSSPFLQKK